MKSKGINIYLASTCRHLEVGLPPTQPLPLLARELANAAERAKRRLYRTRDKLKSQTREVIYNVYDYFDKLHEKGRSLGPLQRTAAATS